MYVPCDTTAVLTLLMHTPLMNPRVDFGRENRRYELVITAAATGSYLPTVVVGWMISYKLVSCCLAVYSSCNANAVPCTGAS